MAGNREIMRVVFTPPSEDEFRRLFLSTPLRKGGGLEDISVFYPSRRRGGGMLSTVTGVARRVLPFLYKAIKPAAREFGKSMLSDMITKERPLKESLKKHGIQAARMAGLRLLKGSGKRMSKKVGKKKVKRVGRKKRMSNTYKNDVYSLL